ncbi:MAG: tetratricopeptide repeat protein [Bacteroidia bacterium]|nr:tetratricopeptide repeat protein [Bacteroidia bacterium]
MQKRYLFYFIILFVFFPLHYSFSQSAKSFFKKGQSQVQSGNCEDAVISFSSAINLKPDYNTAYYERANCYFNLKKYEKALADYAYLYSKDPLKEDYIIKMALTYYSLNRWPETQNMLLKLEAPEMNVHIAEAKVILGRCKIYMHNFEDALQYLTSSIIIFPTNDQIYFYKGNVSDSLKNYQAGVLCYNQALDIIKLKLAKKEINQTTADSLNCIYNTSLSYSQIKIFDYLSAITSLSNAVILCPDKGNTFLQRAFVYLQTNEVNLALNDLQQCEKLNYKPYMYYLVKALVYKKNGQFNNAIESLNFISNYDTAYYANYIKGQCLESIGRLEDAQKAYIFSNSISQSENKKEIEIAVQRIRLRIYETNREKDPPELRIINPETDIDNLLRVSKLSKITEIRGVVLDKSYIKSVMVNGLEAEFRRDTVNPEFRIKLNLADEDSLKVIIVDSYGNESIHQFGLNRMELNPPEHKLFVSYSKLRKQIFTDGSNNKKITISGRVEDESLITKILINNKAASFSLVQLNPLFDAEVDISHTDSIKIAITDEYNNTSVTSYYINKNTTVAKNDNLMGKSWLVFIANSNYENYSTLEGPKNDLKNITQAIDAYKFENIIVKNDMTLSEMEKFFRIELRDLVKEQQVNSLMIWFAGHGKYLNGSGYWLPVNALKDVEITYYPIVYLKSVLTNYFHSLRNILIVSDACESGLSFDISNQKIKQFDCNIPNGQVNRSAYVFSSSTNEKASDNSLFCESFVSLLNANISPCLPLMNLVKPISDIVSKHQNQKCSIGPIKDFSDNTGIFYFLRKED